MFDHFKWIINHQWRRFRPISKRSAPRVTCGPEALEDRQLLSASGKDARAEIHSAHVQERIAKILNGTETSGFPSVGELGDAGSNYGSGTLIGAQWVLTAAHCSPDGGGTDGRFTIDGQTYSTIQVFDHPNYRPRRFNSNKANDIALWKLSEPVVAVDPSPIFRQIPNVGTLLKIVGFGYGGNLDGEDGFYGTKRVGTTHAEKVTKTRLRWVFNEPTESNTGHGDSGGPAFIEVGDTLYVAGVTSGGTRMNAGRGDHAFDTRVDVYQNWIDNVMNGAFDAPAPQGNPRHPGRHKAHLATGNNLQDAVMSDIMQHM